MKKIILLIGLFLIVNVQLKSQNWEDLGDNPIGQIYDHCYSSSYGIFFCGLNNLCQYNNNSIDTIFKIPYPTTLIKSVAISNDTLFFIAHGLKIKKLGHQVEDFQISGMQDTVAATSNKIIIKNNIKYFSTNIGIIQFDGIATNTHINTANIDRYKFDVDSNGIIYFWKNDSLCKIVNYEKILIDTISNLNQLMVNPHTNELFFSKKNLIYKYNGISIQNLSVTSNLYDYNSTFFEKILMFNFSHDYKRIFLNYSRFNYFTTFHVVGNLDSNIYGEIEIPENFFDGQYINTFEIQNKVIIIGGDVYQANSNNFNPIFLGCKRAMIDKGNFRALITKNGKLFYDKVLGVKSFEFPKYSNLHTNLSSTLWISGINQNNDTCLAAVEFEDYGSDFWAGPISNNYDENYDQKYGRVWLINRSEIIKHQNHYNDTNYNAAESISSWPAHGNLQNGESAYIAPFFDSDSNGKYNPENGDYPIVIGVQAAYFIYNDDRNIHTESGGNQLGVEIHGMAFITDTINEDLRHTLFINYNLFNRKFFNFRNFIASKFDDFDLGNCTDDYIGCDSSRNAIYIYNAAPCDGYGSSCYGKAPPCQAVCALKDKMNSFSYFNGFNFDSQMNDPNTTSEYLNYINGFWRFGNPYTIGGNALGGQIPTKFPFYGNPINLYEWSEHSAENQAGERRGLLNFEPINFPKGTNHCYDIAYVYSRECNDTLICNNLSNIPNVLSRIDNVKTYYNDNDFPCTMTNFTFRTTNFPEIQNCPVVSAFFNNSEIDYSIPIDSVQIYDIHSLNPHMTNTSWRIYQQNNVLSLPNILFNVQNNIPVIFSINLMHNPSEKIMNSHSILYYTNGIVAISEKNINPISVFPNPANQNIRISGIENVHSIEITDLLGSIVYKTTSNNLNYIDIDVSKFKKGIYILKTTSKNEQVFSKKIVVQ